MATAKKNKNKPWKTGTSCGHITIYLETFDIYVKNIWGKIKKIKKLTSIDMYKHTAQGWFPPKLKLEIALNNKIAMRSSQVWTDLKINKINAILSFSSCHFEISRSIISSPTKIKTILIARFFFHQLLKVKKKFFLTFKWCFGRMS